MISEEKVVKQVEGLLNEVGYTLSDFIRVSGRYNSSLLMLDNASYEQSIELYNTISKGGLKHGEKGKKLEELTTILFEKSVKNLFDVYRNCRTSTNEIDLLIRWTENARLLGINNSFSCFGDSFLCECKNYKGPVNVTYVGKFCSLMLVTNTDFGVMVSWDGVTGRSDWNDSKGLIKKIALRDKRFIVVLDKDDLGQICNRKKSIFSIIYDKYIALKNEIDYSKYIAEHEATEKLQ